MFDGVGAGPGRDRPHGPGDAASRTAGRARRAAATIDPFVALEKLADLHARGVVDAAEFAAKKRELLGRI